LLVFAAAGTSDALVHQKLDVGPAIFGSPGSSLVGGDGLLSPNAPGANNAANWNAAVVNQIGGHCLSAFLAQHLVAGSGAHRRDSGCWSSP
jgi:hypothetical protein